MTKEYFSAFGKAEKRKAPCPECEKETRVDTLFEQIDRWQDEGADIAGVVENYVFQCRGCEEIFFAKSTGDSEDYYDYLDQFTGEFKREFIDRKIFWPTVSQNTAPSWANLDLAKADSTLHDLLQSIYTALNADLGVLAAIGMRTAFDRVSEILEVETNLTFAKNWKSLKTPVTLVECKRAPWKCS